MAWRYMVLRGSKVLARCNDDGSLASEGGRVEIRYRRQDGRAYRAGARNLRPSDDATVFPDAHCGEAEAAPDKSAGNGGAKGKRGPSRKSKGSGVPPPSAAEAGEVLIYGDGACSGNPGPAGLGVVMLFGDERWEYSEYLGRATNNIAELTAILRAVEGLPDGDRPVRMFTDSSYSIGVLTKGWKAKANQQLVADIKAAIARCPSFTLHYVKGHAGIPLNERADELARIAIETRSTAEWMDLTRQSAARPPPG